MWYVEPQPGKVRRRLFGRRPFAARVRGERDGAKLRSLRPDFRAAGYDLVSLNEVFSAPELRTLAGYNAPDVASLPSFADVLARLEAALGRKILVPTVISFSEDSPDTVTLYEQDNSVIDLLDEVLEELSSDLCCDYEVEADYELKLDSEPQPLSLPKIDSDIRFRVVGSAPRESAPAPEVPSAPAPPPEEITKIERLLSILRNNNEESLRRLGLDADLLRFLLGSKVRYSKMRITRHAKIVLVDYGREIKMDSKTKALYFLFLRHPEGLCIKDLPDYFDELLDLYQSISGRGDKDAMHKTIEDLANPFRNDANVSLSRIKKAFAEAFENDLAKAYYVDGRKGETRKIALDRSLVEWETIR